MKITLLPVWQVNYSCIEDTSVFCSFESDCSLIQDRTRSFTPWPSCIRVFGKLWVNQWCEVSQGVTKVNIDRFYDINDSSSWKVIRV